MKHAFRIIVIALLACNSDRSDKPVNYNIATSPIVMVIRNGDQAIRIGDSIELNAEYSGDISQFKEIILLLNDSVHGTYEAFPFNLKLPTGHLSLGKNNFRINAVSEKKVENKTIEFTLMSDTAPSSLEYQVVNSHPHDVRAFTQGLFFHNGFIYEGTGQRGSSGVRRVEITTGKILQEQSLAANVFGEGICLLHNKIYQLSWNEGIAFVFNLDDLSQTRRFNYKGEGWGLATDGRVFFRSDGSNIIHVHDTADFRELKTIEVYSDAGPLNKLNELEFIEGRIYANIWQKDEIAVINPINGKQEYTISLKGLLPAGERSATTDVLNGIAYNSADKTLFVTGKYWPKLFEIKLRTPL